MHMVPMVACVKEIKSIRFAKLSNAKTTKGPKVVMRCQNVNRRCRIARDGLDQFLR